jgi:hypothetical protein
MTSLWQAVGSTCGANTLDQINALAGQNNLGTSAAASLIVSSVLAGSVALAAAAVMAL